MNYEVIYHHEIPDDLVNIPVNIKQRILKAIESRLLVDPINYGLPLRKSLQWGLGDGALFYKDFNKDVEHLTNLWRSK